MPGIRRIRAVGAIAVAATLTISMASACRHEKAATGQSTDPVVIESVDVPTMVPASGATASVAVSAAATRVSADVNAGQIAFRRQGKNWTADLKPGSALRTGVNSIYLQAASARRSSAMVQRSVYVLGQSADLGLTATDTSADDGVLVTIQTKVSVAATTITVNGTDASNLLTPHALRQQVALGAGDGLVRGRNTILVTTVLDDGRWQSATVTKMLDTKAPLAEAGAQQQGRVGIETTLDASRSVSVAAGKQTRYQWSIEQAPPGSHAVLTDPTSMKPRFTPDVAGCYRFKVKVSGTGGTSSDLVTVATTTYYPPIGARLQTSALGQANDFEMQVQGTAVATMPIGVPRASMLAIYDRQTLALTAHVSSTATSVNQAEQDEVDAISQANQAEQEQAYPQGYLAILSVAAGPAAVTLPVVNALGATPDLAMLSGAPFSLIVLTGTGGAPTVWRSTGTSTSGAGQLEGYLQISNGGPSAYSPYQYVPGVSLGYDTASSSTPTSNVMSFGCPGSSCTNVASTSLSTSCPQPGPLGGFQLTAVRATDLSFRTGNSLTVTTNDGCGGPADLASDLRALGQIQTFLARFPSTGPGTDDHLIAVQSIGTPRPVAPQIIGDWSAFTTAWLQLGATLVKYGATSAPFDAVGSTGKQGYALLGSTATTLPGSDSPFGKETSADNPSGSVARLAGLLGRNHRYDLDPIVNVDGAGLNTMVGATIYQPTQNWKVPRTPGEQAALQYITDITGPNLDPSQDISVQPQSGGVCYDPQAPSFRNAYCNPGLPWITISSKLQDLENSPPSNPTGFSATDWKNVVAQLVTETAEVSNISTITTYLQQPFTVADQGADLAQAVAAVKKSLAPPSTPYHAYGTSTWLSMVGDLAGVAWAIAGFFDGAEAIGAIAGLVSEGFAIAADFTTRNGKPEVAQPAVALSAQNLADELATRYFDAAKNIGYLATILATDPGKLAAATAFVNRYGTSTTNANAAMTNLSNAATAWLDANLLATIYQPTSLWLPQPGNASKNPYWRPYQGDASTFLCNGALPFKSVPTLAEQYQSMQAAPDSAADQPVPVHWVLSEPGSPFAKGNISIAPDSILAKLTANPATAEGNLGMPPAYLYERILGLSSKSQQSCSAVNPSGIGSPAVSGPLVAVASTAGTQTVFAKSKNNVLAFQYSQISNSWQLLPALPAPADGGSPLAAGSAGAGDIHVFYLVKGKPVTYWSVNGGPWQGPTALPASVSPDKGSAFAVTAHGPGRLDLVYVQKGVVTLESFDSATGFSANPVGLPGQIDNKGQLAVAYSQSGGEHVFFVSRGKLSNDYLLPGSTGWQGPGGLVGKPDAGTPLAAASFSDGAWNLFYTQQGELSNTYVQNNAPAGGPGLVSLNNAKAGLATAGAGSSVPPSVLFVEQGLLLDSRYTSQGWQIATVIAAVPSQY